MSSSHRSSIIEAPCKISSMRKDLGLNPSGGSKHKKPKHCHFSILYNELPFLKQKLPFLYKHFDQLIFYDLNILDNTFSNDGSHEFIKEFYDPDKKITLIEKTDLSNIKYKKAVSFEKKSQMFTVGSWYVRDEIDYFWCTDMDEFFNTSLITSVEQNIGPKETAFVPHVVFFQNEHHIGSKDGYTLIPFPYTRVAKHTPGYIYGHCTLHTKFNPKQIQDIIYHFAFVGKQRMKFKKELYKSNDPIFDLELRDDEVINFSALNAECVELYDQIVLNTYIFPDYIDINVLMSDLCAQR